MTRFLSLCFSAEDWQAQVIGTLFTHWLKMGALPALHSALHLPGGLPGLNLETLTPRLPRSWAAAEGTSQRQALSPSS